MKTSEVYVRYRLIVWHVQRDLRDNRLTLYASALNVCNTLRQVFLCLGVLDQDRLGFSSVF